MEEAHSHLLGDICRLLRLQHQDMIIVFVAMYSDSYISVLVSSIISVIVHLLGFVYLSLCWQLVCVVYVLKDFRGIDVMNKIKALIRETWG